MHSILIALMLASSAHGGARCRPRGSTATTVAGELQSWDDKRVVIATAEGKQSIRDRSSCFRCAGRPQRRDEAG